MGFVAKTDTVGHTGCVSSTKNTVRVVTLTPNPSMDVTVNVPVLKRGEVARISQTRKEAGGKGVNVAHACAKAGIRTIAIAPCAPSDPFADVIRELPVQFHPVAIAASVRTNTAIVEDDATTTKINEPGARLCDDEKAAVESAIDSVVADAEAVVLAGSLPPGVPTDWYADLVERIRRVNAGALVAVDTSDAPLQAIGERLDTSAPDVLKPNAFELAQLTGGDGSALERSASEGDYVAIVSAAQKLIDHGVNEVLVTLGGAGACLVTRAGAWASTPPPVTVLSTVGAGDSSLAGYLMARIAGDEPAECLRRAVAYGSAAASLPGTGIPSPSDIDLEHTHVFPV